MMERVTARESALVQKIALTVTNQFIAHIRDIQADQAISIGATIKSYHKTKITRDRRRRPTYAIFTYTLEPNL